MSNEVQPVEEDEEPWQFTAEDILKRLREEFPKAYCEQTGGGTATLYIRKGDDDVMVTAGPGSYNWGNGDASTFYTGEFYAGMDDYLNNGEQRDEVPPGLDFTGMGANDAEFDRVAQAIAGLYAKYNDGTYPA